MAKKDMDTTRCPVDRLGYHYIITIGKVTFCMECGKVYHPQSMKGDAQLAEEAALK